MKGDITTQEIVIEGSITGEIKASDRVYVKEGAIVKGPIRTKTFLLEDGARHNGILRLHSREDLLQTNLSKPVTLSEQLQKEISEEKKKSEGKKKTAGDTQKRTVGPAERQSDPETSTERLW